MEKDIDIILWQVVNGTYGKGIISMLKEIETKEKKTPTPENLKPLVEGFQHAARLMRYFHVDNGGTYKDVSCLDEYNMILGGDGKVGIIPKWNRPDSEMLFAIGFLSNTHTIYRDYRGG